MIGFPARGAEPVFPFDIAAQDLASALITLALQSNISIGRQPGTPCASTTPGVKGRYTIDSALAALLKTSGCSFRRIDRGDILIVPAAVHAIPPMKPKRRPQAPQEPAAASDIVVTATRRAESIERSPYDETRLAGPELINARVVDSGGLASLVSGMTVTNLGPGRDKILLRGLSDGVFTGRTQSTVALYLDDVPLTYNAPDPDLRLVDVEAVEVLRGPQGVLYGAGSIGGVVHVITHKPDLETYSGSLETTGSATENGAPSWALEGVLNLPLFSDRLGMRLVAYREEDGGYVDDRSLGRKEVNQTTRTGARALTLLQLTPDWKVTLGGIYQSINSADTQYAVSGYGAYARPNLVPEPHDNDFDEVSIVVEGAGPGWRFKSSTSKIHHQIASQYDASDSLPLFSPEAMGAGLFSETDRKSIVTQEFTLASDTTSRLQWIGGLFALNDHETSLLSLQVIGDPGLAAAALYSEDRVDGMNEYAAYGEVTYNPIRRFYFTIGGRFFDSDGVTGSIVAAGSTTRSLNEKVHDAGVAPKAVARFQISSSAMAYLQAAQGYRSSGLNTSGPAGQTFSETSRGTQPFYKYSGDRLWNYEAGAKISFFKSTLTLRTAVFYDSWRNIQTDQILPSGLPYTSNVGDGVNKGIEIEALYQPTPRLSFRGNAVLNDPELVDRAVGFAGNPDASLPGVARTTVGVEAGYRRPLSPALTAFADARASYVGSSTVTFDQTTDATMGRYTTSEITVGLEFKSMRLELFADNPANTLGNTFAFGNPFSLRAVRQTTPLRPRTIGLTLRAAF